MQKTALINEQNDLYQPFFIGFTYNLTLIIPNIILLPETETKTKRV